MSDLSTDILPAVTSKNTYGTMIKSSSHAKKRFKCPYCYKLFERTYVLKCHIRHHTGEKPYVCKICSRRFSQRYPLLRHLARFHPGEKPDT